MDIEYDVKVVPINNEHRETLEKMQAEGWELMPGVMPVSIYHVIRNKNKPAPAQEAGAFGGIIIDDSKVQIIRGNGDGQKQ